MKRFLIALQFLTIFPIKINSEIAEKDFGRSLLYFPVVGMLIGVLLSAVALLFSFLSDSVAGVLILITSVFVTGGIHLDGFADTCDGFYGYRSGEKILEIMRDSRVGVMGVLGIVCLLLLKFVLIVNVSQDILWKLLIMMTVFARWSQVLACCISDYAREEGKARYFMEFSSKKDLFVAGIFTVVLFLLLMKLDGIVLLVFSLPPILVFVKFAKKKIGGMTGDTIGAMSEVAEVLILLFYLLLANLNM